MISLSSKANLPFPIKRIEAGSYRKFPSAHILKATTLLKLTGKTSSGILSPIVNLGISK